MKEVLINKLLEINRIAGIMAYDQDGNYIHDEHKKAIEALLVDIRRGILELDIDNPEPEAMTVTLK